MTDTDVTLRPIEEGDLAFLQDLTGNIANRSSFQSHGFSDPREWRRRWDTPGAMMGEHGGVVLVMCGDVAAGMVSWSHQGWFGNQCWSIGITLSPAMRGRGYGTLAQRQLVDYLFRQTQVERIEAYTDAANEPERRALLKAGFTFEGTLRRARFRDGGWADGSLYSILRSEVDLQSS